MSVISAIEVHVTGLVQGVGFRPFIYRLAIRNHLAGWVMNGNDGVRIFAQGSHEQLQDFIHEIAEMAPEASTIRQISVVPACLSDVTDFRITKSRDSSDEITEISPDIAVCAECLKDIRTQPHRIGYPFINCTNCGPRFTIIRDLPYDREKTTMASFKMCPVCQSEYSDILDRRFHAQPVACHACGPHYELLTGDLLSSDAETILRTVGQMITEGKILAIKGLGGYHLACDALQEHAVSRLRNLKNREGKPFAVMFRDIDHAKRYTLVNQEEEKQLLSWRRPIVILCNRNEDERLSPSVSNGFNTTGAMLPFMPFHYQLFGQLKTGAIVLTSGNFSDEPIIIDNRNAELNLTRIADGVLSYNRDIFNRTDDSVTMVVLDQPRLIRRSRGYVPSPWNLNLHTDGIFAAGAELVNCFCVGKKDQAIMSQHIGDLKNLETIGFYTESFQRFRQMFRVNITHVACDLHPDYLSTRFAEELALSSGNLPLFRIQHHHAHIGSCMAENNLDEPVIGISMDGVGLGTDGKIWGFEVMAADLLDFKRLSHLEYIEQPGGDQATHEPWRMALAYILKYSGADTDLTRFQAFNAIHPEKLQIVRQAILHGINAPLTSSAGRLFDAIAALTGICTSSSFHAEAPMRLENLMNSHASGLYSIGIGETIDPGMMIREVIQDLESGTDPSVISGKFHRTMVRTVVEVSKYARELTGLEKVALSGGVFQNRFLLAHSISGLKAEGFQVFSQRHFPSNDGGVALGQMAIAAKRRVLSIE